MHECPRCGYIERDEDECEVAGCHLPAEYEGWYKLRDFAGIPTGLIQRRRVCSVHTSLLMGQKPESTNLPCTAYPFP